MADKYEQLENLARNLIGASRAPKLFFVTDQGVVVTITADHVTAYDHWLRIADEQPQRECALEYTRYGTICSVEPREDSPRLARMDDFAAFIHALRLEQL